MKFCMLKISGSKTNDGRRRYESTIMEQGASIPWKRTFESQYQMMAVINDILTRQKGDLDVRRFLSKIHEGEQYFFDLDLTEGQARSLGWAEQDEAQHSQTVMPGLS